MDNNTISWLMITALIGLSAALIGQAIKIIAIYQLNYVHFVVSIVVLIVFFIGFKVGNHV